MRGRRLALAVAVCLLCSGCGGEEPAASPSPAPVSSPPAADTPAPQAARVFTLPVDPAGGWDPYVGSKSGNMTLAPLLYESLFQLDGSFDCHPLLAREAQVSEDGLTWTVKLREGITFSGGQSLDAAAAAAALEAARGEQSVYAARLSGVRSVTAAEPDTLVFTLASPNARFPALLDVPIALVDEAGVWGTGPYVLRGDRLTARTDWWRGVELPLEEIALLEIGDAETLVNAFDSGRLSLAAADPTSPSALGYAGSYQSWEYATSSMLYLGFQCGKGPCRSAEFRRAVSRAVDREGLVSQVLGGHAVAAALPAPASSGLYDGLSARELEWDPESAGQILDSLGYRTGEDGRRMSGGKNLSLTLLVNSDNVYKERLARSIAEALGQLGVDVQVQTLAWEEYKTALSRGEFDLYLAECRLTGDLDPSPFLTGGSGLCYGGFQDWELAQALAQARLTGEWGDFYLRWAQQAPLAVICFKNAQLLTQWEQVKGADPTQGNLFYQFEDWIIG